MINPEWLEGTYVVRNEGLPSDNAPDTYTAAQSRISLTKYREFVSSNPSSVHFFQPILDVLEYRPSNLEMVPAVAMVEGKNDYYTLALAIKQTNMNALHILPGSGSGTLDSMIRLYTAWGRPFVILLDSDGEGKKQKRRYEAIFGPIIAGRIFELGDIDPAFLSKELENILSASESLAFQKAVYKSSTKLDKKTFNRSIQEQLLSNSPASLGPSSLASLKKVLIFLSDTLDSMNS
ncbi:MAG: hypothetical protein EOP10_32645 [Proteobacteria bacterium]|nr:MAG: hypothetical protein EOP10_32645 [Pseudomonadota bacterium]